MNALSTQPPPEPRITIAEVQRETSEQLSRPSRFGYSALLVASLTMAVVIGSLLATESALPGRTRIAFVVMIGIGLGWSAFSAWVLSNRRVMFGHERVIAARMALTFCVLSTLVMLGVAALGGGGRAAYGAAAAETVLCVIAAVVLIRARRYVERLSVRKQQLERAIHARVEQ